MLRKLSAAGALVTIIGMSTPAVASENWPDSIDQYVLQIRKSVNTSDMDGYLAAVKNPNGAVLLERQPRPPNLARPPRVRLRVQSRH